MTFIVVTVFSALGLVLSLFLHFRTAHLYERVIEDTLIERSKRGREVSPSLSNVPNELESTANYDTASKSTNCVQQSLAGQTTHLAEQ